MRPERFITKATDAGTSVLDTKTGDLSPILSAERAMYAAHGLNLMARFVRSDQVVRDMLARVS